MPKKSSGSSIKKPKTYEALKDKGMSKERAAMISTAQGNKEKSGMSYTTASVKRSSDQPGPRAYERSGVGAPSLRP